MPTRNRTKFYVQEAYYHVYNRGLNKKVIFKDEQDYAVFLNLLKRYLDNKPTTDNKGRQYEWLHERLELLAFCLMANHFHLLIYQHDEEAMTRLMRGVSTAYSTYFNKKYRRSGSLFQERFKASLIGRDEYLQHISRYIHLNPKKFQEWEFSSLPYYLGKKKAGWLRAGRMLELFNEGEYLKFVKDYQSHKKMLELIKSELASE